MDHRETFHAAEYYKKLNTWVILRCYARCLGSQVPWGCPQQMIQYPTLKSEAEKSEESQVQHFENSPAMILR